MPRRNRNSKVVRLKSRHSKFADPDAPMVPAYTWGPIEKVVIPDGKCTLHRRQKDRYDTEAKALAAMQRINHQRQNHPESRKIKRVYLCPEETCGGWHLTSRTEFDEEQARMIHNRKNHIDEEQAS